MLEDKITKEELLKFESWIKNTWSIEEKDKFYSLIFRLNNEGLTPENEELSKEVRELIVKKQDEFKANYAEERAKIEDEIERTSEAIRRHSIELSALEAKLSVKENYLIKGFDHAAMTIAINLDQDIAQITNKIQELDKEKNQLQENRIKELEVLKEKQRITEALINQAKTELSMVGNSEEKHQQLMRDYHELTKENEQLKETIENFDSEENLKNFEEEIQKFDVKLDQYNRQLVLFQERKKQNDAILNGEKKYNESAIRLDEDRVHYLKSGIEATKRRLAAMEEKVDEEEQENYVETYDKYINQYKKETPVIEDEEPVKVVKTTPWQWVKEHKKQILIALGLTALAVSAIVLVTQVLPAIVAAQQAAQTAGLFTQMAANGSAWATASAAEQAALHGANTALANIISSTTGAVSSFNTATGVWTIGGKVFGDAAAAAGLAAVKAQGALSALQGITLATGLGGLGAIGAGVLLPKRSETYKKINAKLKDLKTNKYMNEDEFNNIITSVSNEILSSNELSEKEQQILLKSLKAIIRNRNKNVVVDVNIEKDNEVLEEQPKEEVIIDNEPIDIAPITPAQVEAELDFEPIDIAEFGENGEIILSDQAPERTL